MKLSIIIPVYNEVGTIARLLGQVEGVDLDFAREIIVVDDGSTDGTTKLLKNLKQGVTVLFHKKNKGKTASIRTALKAAKGDIIIIQDADLEYPPQENYKVLLRPIVAGWADCVYGSRFLGTHRVFYFWHYLANKLLTGLTNFLYDTMLTDMETGAKAFKREVFAKIKLTSQGFCFEPEITAKAFKNKFRVYEVPITYCGREFSQGKKIRPIDGLKATLCLLKYRFTD